MRYLILVLPLALAACMSIDDDVALITQELTPYTNPDGSKGFTFSTTNYLPSYMQGQNMKEVHMYWLRGHISSAGVCQNGYEITGHKDVKEYRLRQYQGVCR